jgi:hypothetical protein
MAIDSVASSITLNQLRRFAARRLEGSERADTSSSSATATCDLPFVAADAV